MTTNRLTDKECRSKLCPSGRMAKPKQTASTPRFDTAGHHPAFCPKKWAGRETSPSAHPIVATIRGVRWATPVCQLDAANTLKYFNNLGIKLVCEPGPDAARTDVYLSKLFNPEAERTLLIECAP